MGAMSAEKTDALPGPGQISPGAVGVISLLVWGLALGALVGAIGWPGAMLAVATQLPVAVAIFLAAGGWGYLLICKLLPAGTPDGLRVVTCVGVGLWALSTAVLAVGSAIGGALIPQVWWPVIIVGWVIAAAASRERLHQIRLPAQLPGAGVLWVFCALAAAIWVAGATMPAGTIGRATGDFYDVVSYHLQAPREFHDNGRITFLPHNTYSNYPFGAEMLFLLTMALRGGAYAGAFAAKFTHGLWAVLAVGAVYFALPTRYTWRRRAAAVLLATVPLGLYLSWLAFVEWSELAYLAIGIAWLRTWLDKPTARSSVCVGLAAGAACATKYLSVGLVAGPLLAVMLAVCAFRRGRLTHWLLACVACVALFSPWLIRNAVNTGNPVFPLATGTFGRGHWSAEQAARWDAAHPPPPMAERPGLVFAAAIDDRGVGVVTILLAVVAAGWTLARGRGSDPLDRLCLGIAACQLLVWAGGTHMATRFIVPIAVPAVILIGGFTAWLTRMGTAAVGRRGRRAAEAPWGFFLAAVLVLAAAGLNAATAWHLYRTDGWTTHPDGGTRGLNGLAPDELAGVLRKANVVPEFPPDARLLMCGDVRPFNFPASTLYATVWDDDPLAVVVADTDPADPDRPRQILRRLRREYGITHIWLNWSEIGRIQKSYNWPPQITRRLAADLVAAGATPMEVAPTLDLTILAIDH